MNSNIIVQSKLCILAAFVGMTLFASQSNAQVHPAGTPVIIPSCEDIAYSDYVNRNIQARTRRDERIAQADADRLAERALAYSIFENTITNGTCDFYCLSAAISVYNSAVAAADEERDYIIQDALSDYQDDLDASQDAYDLAIYNCQNVPV
ncbi:MAG: hypothetical protein ED559_06275 [Phycisphaera sp.]|nr:MAG: hypothetical protein ED559_06275 [Phycisphaera sp.]